MMPKQCDDNNPKVVKRTYQWDKKQVDILLCEQHRHDSDFSHYVLEIKL